MKKSLNRHSKKSSKNRIFAVIWLVLMAGIFVSLKANSILLNLFGSPLSINRVADYDDPLATTALEKKANEAANIKSTKEGMETNPVLKNKAQAELYVAAKTAETASKIAGDPRLQETATTLTYDRLKKSVEEKLIEDGFITKSTKDGKESLSITSDNQIKIDELIIDYKVDNLVTSGSSTGSTSCPTAGNPVPNGTWVASGCGWKEGGNTCNKSDTTTQRECMKCDNGSYDKAGSRACDGLLASGQPVVLPPGADSMYTGCTSSNSEACKVSVCYSNAGGSWNIIGIGGKDANGDLCSPKGKLMDPNTEKGKFDDEMNAFCAARNAGDVYDSGECKKMAADVPPNSGNGNGSGVETPEQIAAKLKSDCAKNNRGVVGGKCGDIICSNGWTLNADGRTCTAPDSLSSTQISSAIMRCEEVGTQVFDLGTGKCVTSRALLSSAGQSAIDCKPGLQSNGYYVSCSGNYATGALASEWNGCSAYKDTVYVVGVGCVAKGTAVNPNGIFTGGEKSKTSTGSDCIYGMDKNTKVCLYPDKTSTPPTLASNPANLVGSGINSNERPSSVSPEYGNFDGTNDWIYEAPNGKRYDDSYCGDDPNSCMEGSTCKLAAWNNSRSRCVPNTVENVDNANQVVEQGSDLYSAKAKDGESCEHSGDAWCESNDCRLAKKPGTEKESWYCMSSKNSYPDDVRENNFTKGKNGKFCLGNNNLCVSGYCAKAATWFIPDTCQDNPFIELPGANNAQSSLNLSPSQAFTAPQVAQADSASIDTGQPTGLDVNPLTPAGLPAANVSGGQKVEASLISQSKQFRPFYQGDYENGIKENGCYLTVASMIISNYGTIDRGLNPEELNKKYLNNKYVYSGYDTIFDGVANEINGINMIAVSDEARGNVSAYVANHATIDRPVSLAIYCSNCYEKGHFVLAVGKNDKGEPLIYDPLREGQTDPIPLNSSNYPGLDLSKPDVHLVESSNQ